MRFSFIPRERKFFDLFEEDARNAAKAAQLLDDLVNHWENIEFKVSQINDVEHEGDEITHRIMAELHSTFVTPLDREDIAALANAIDDVVDLIQAAADAMLVYKIQAPTHRAKELAAIIVQGADELARALPDLRRPGDLKEVLTHCVELNRLENAADRVHRSALGELFTDRTEVTDIIKWREIYNHLESATDRAEDVANVLEGVALKHA
ncbi:MAG: DUF47 domain-containing protein [Chloroflexi bacterium]|nr:DUF47 domain-containing protein [Chloroflexota bacterium]